MDPEEILDRQIENYIHHRMDESERAAFERSLAADPTLKIQVYELLELKSMYSKELFELKQKLNNAEGLLKDDNFFSDGPGNG